MFDACWSVGSQARVACRALPHVVEPVTPAGSDPSSRKSWKDARTMTNLASTGTRIAKGPIGVKEGLACQRVLQYIWKSRHRGAWPDRYCNRGHRSPSCRSTFRSYDRVAVQNIPTQCRQDTPSNEIFWLTPRRVMVLSRRSQPT